MNVHVTSKQKGRSFGLFALLLAAMAGLSFGGAVAPAFADDDGKKRNRAQVVEPGKTLFGRSYNRLTGNWANWLGKEPFETNPANDPDGRYCHLNQKGKIWYLAGTFGGIADRFCEVPAGKGIFFPIFSFVGFLPDIPTAAPCDLLAGDLAQIRCDVNDDIAISPNVGLSVIIDGKPVDDLFAYRAQSQPGGYTLRLGPLFQDFGFPAGKRSPAVSDGYWVLLKPLSPGLHTLSFSADFDVDGIPDLGANYELLVVGDDDDDDDDDEEDDD